MSFVQYEFLVFIAIFLPLYYACASRLFLQNLLVLSASIVFYAWWSKPLVLLILFESLVAYYAAKLIESHPQHKKVILWSTISILFAILGYFKYANFFIDSFIQISSMLGIIHNPLVLDIILPIGISFHTFQTLAYVIDVYRGDFRADNNLLRFTSFTIFFPQLVAGPVERAHDLLPQFSRVRQLTIKGISRAIHLIVLGYFFKVFIADTAAEIANVGFSPDTLSGWWTILGTIAFGLQIYCDFMGYSLIAKGIAGLMGFELSWNFSYPYWATSIRDFWKAWHITLSQWLRDYLYIPLGGNRGSNRRTSLNLVITMTLGGLWHGANWTFIAWGLFHGLALVIYHQLLNTPVRLHRLLKATGGWVVTMLVVYIGWFLFRARNWSDMTAMVYSLSQLEWFPAHTTALITLIFLHVILIASEMYERKTNNRYAILDAGKWQHSVIYGAMLFMTIVYAQRAQFTFIYFQF